MTNRTKQELRYTLNIVPPIDLLNYHWLKDYTWGLHVCIFYIGCPKNKALVTIHGWLPYVVSKELLLFQNKKRCHNPL